MDISITATPPRYVASPRLAAPAGPRKDWFQRWSDDVECLAADLTEQPRRSGEAVARPPADRGAADQARPCSEGLSRGDLVALLDRVRREGWDGVAGLTLLREAERVIRPLVRNVARRHGVAAEELSNAALTAAWAALRRYDARQSPDPRGWLALVARRAAVDEALMARTGHAARNRARLAAAVAAARQALSDELGRSPAPVEVRARLSRSMRAEADRCEAAAHLDAFIGIAAAEPVDLDADAVAGLTPRGTDRGCPRLGAVARAIAEEQRIQPARAQGAAELAADLAADLIPTLGVDETRRLVAAELARSPLSVRLPRPAGQRLFDAIMTALGDGAGRPPSAA